MDNESIHIAKLVAWPEMATTYRWLSAEITGSLTNPALQAIHETLRIAEPSSGLHSRLDRLTEDALARFRSPKVRTKEGVTIETSSAKICVALENIREVAGRLEQEPTEARLTAENSFRDWLERSLVQRAAFEEPSTLRDTDPIRKAIANVEALKAIKPVFSPGEDDISFPLASFKIERKPKTPTSVDPFDEEELSGGGEEDTTMILSGESNIGKSHLGLFCLSSLSIRRHPVLICSGEDSLDTTKLRIFAHYLRRPDKEISNMTELEIAKAFEALYGDPEDLESLHYHIVNNLAIACIPEGAFTPKKIEEKLDSFEQKRQRKIKAFMADYLQKMNENAAGRNPRRQRDEELEFTVNQTKALCQDRKVFGIIISQVPSHAAGGAAEFLNLKQAVARSYAATWGAHYVMTMNRTAEEIRRLATSSDKRPRINLFLCKNKTGPLGVCYALGIPQEARWEFFRTKGELERRVESEKITATFEPGEFRKNPAREKI